MKSGDGFGPWRRSSLARPRRCSWRRRGGAAVELGQLQRDGQLHRRPRPGRVERLPQLRHRRRRQPLPAGRGPARQLAQRPGLLQPARHRAARPDGRRQRPAEPAAVRRHPLPAPVRRQAGGRRRPARPVRLLADRRPQGRSPSPRPAASPSAAAPPPRPAAAAVPPPSRPRPPDLLACRLPLPPPASPPTRQPGSPAPVCPRRPRPGVPELSTPGGRRRCARRWPTGGPGSSPPTTPGAIPCRRPTRRTASPVTRPAARAGSTGRRWCSTAPARSGSSSSAAALSCCRTSTSGSP